MESTAKIAGSKLGLNVREIEGIQSAAIVGNISDPTQNRGVNRVEGGRQTALDRALNSVKSADAEMQTSASKSPRQLITLRC